MWNSPSLVNWLWLTGIICFGLHVNTASASHVTVKDVTEALSKLLDYYIRDSGLANLDAIMAGRTVEGQIEPLLDALKSADENQISKLPSGFVEAIHTILNKAYNFSELATNAVKLIIPVYYAKMGIAVRKGIWVLPPTPDRYPNQDLIYSYTSNFTLFTNNISDNCIEEVIKQDGNCKITDECWQFMTSPNFFQYSLTHELIYLALGQKIGCLDEMNRLASKFNQKNVEFLYQEFCTNVIYEMNLNEQQGFPYKYHDLLWEQIWICGALRFKDVYSETRLKKLLSQQDPSGCYITGEKKDNGNFVKRNEKILSGGCSAHQTAVAAAAMSVYLRIMTENILKL